MDTWAGGINMNRNIRMSFILLLSGVVLLGAAPDLGAIPFSETKIIIEINATAGDGGIQIFLDAAGWNRLEVSDPNGQEIFDVEASGSAGTTGITELFCESAEPSFQELPLNQMLARFVAGNYTFSGTTVEGGRLSGKATLSHAIPAGPMIVSPAEGATINASFPVVIDWDPVADPFPGTNTPVTVAGYQVIVERVKPQPLLVFSVNLPAALTQVTVSPEFVQAGADYNVEVLAIEVSGNQTISERRFATAR